MMRLLLSFAVVDASRIIDSTADRGDSVYLAVMIMLFALAVFAGVIWFLLRIWNEIRTERTTERETLVRSMHAVAITTNTLQHMLVAFNLTAPREELTTEPACREYLNRLKELERLQEEQQTKLARLFPTS